MRVIVVRVIVVMVIVVTVIVVGLKRIFVLFDYSIVLTVFECYCSYSNIRFEVF